MRKKISKLSIAVALLLAMAGCTTPKQWKADSEVDALCAKDGGMKVYETVTLSKERFNEYGQFTGISIGENTKSNEEYYIIQKFKDITENSNSGNIDIYQNHFQIYRRRDQKLLGESINYSRRGGDLLPAHPSAYSCYKQVADDLLKQVFLKSN